MNRARSSRKGIHNLAVMGFQVGPRRSNVWDAVKALDKIINDPNFARTLKN